ncbi:rust resistance kinase Lr10-like [Euphorbia lathyris]|uniref:rust resistance kinase Lr10-like n=1 Tax=Euphorbia lathyris TaxID=212925 RepID=UPI003313F5F6
MSNFKGLVVIVIVVTIFYLSQVAAEEDECLETSCREGGPVIRFPFRLKDRQPCRCGYPGFDLFCTKHNHTLLELPFSVNLFVKRIDYKNQMIHLQEPAMCLPRHLQNLNLSSSPFHFNQPYQHGFTFFNCTSVNEYVLNISCLGSPGYKVYAVLSDTNMAYIPSFSSCTKMYDISPVPYDVFDENNDLVLNWWEPFCSDCADHKQKCRLKSDTTSPLKTECYGNLETRKGETQTQLIAVSVLCFLIPVVVIAIICYIYRANKAERENQVRIERFLEDYKALKPIRYCYADIKRITNNFKDKLGEGAYGTVFKGKLCHGITVAVKILNFSKGNGDEFINEVGTIGRIHHVNVVRLVGYCADGFRRALVYEFLPNESLEKFIFSKDRNKHVLGWEKLLKIALGVAKGIEYLHQGCEQRILHFDIKPQNVLLDYNFNPKISDFGLAKLCSKDRSAVTMTAARGTMGYVAPEVFSRNFGNVSCKSDVYSFGMLLLEMVGGRKNTDEKVKNGSGIYFPEWIYNHLNKGEELRICIGGEEGDAEIAKRVAIVGLWCIQWHPVNRPSMKTVIQMLERDNLRIPPNPFSSNRSYTSSQIMNQKSSEQELAATLKHKYQI